MEALLEPNTRIRAMLLFKHRTMVLLISPISNKRMCSGVPGCLNNQEAKGEHLISNTSGSIPFRCNVSKYSETNPLLHEAAKTSPLARPSVIIKSISRSSI